MGATSTAEKTPAHGGPHVLLRACPWGPSCLAAGAHETQDLLVKPSVLDTVMVLFEADRQHGTGTDRSAARRSLLQARMGGDSAERRVARATTVANFVSPAAIRTFVDFRRQVHPLKANLLRDEYMLEL